jgi:hypothetical protein
MQSQHTYEWAKYQTLSPTNKLAYFNKKEATGINAFLDKDRDSLTFAISQPAIVDDIVGNLFFNPKEDEEDDDSEPITKANAMKLFKLQEDGSYLVIIKNSLRFNLAIEHVSIGLSFHQTAAVITQHRNLCKNSKLAGLNDHMVGQFVRVLLAVALQSMSTIMNQKHVWEFSLAADASSHMGVSLLDQRIRICVEGVLYNLHMVLVPFFERHLAVNYVELIKTMFDTLCPNWRSKLISISSDGENTMTGRHGGVVTLLEKECNNPVLRIWCVPYQLDIVVKNATQDVLDQAFYKVAHAYSIHLRVQQNLIMDMGSKCPKDTMRWVAFGSILHWLLQNYRRLMIHNAAKRPVQVPSEMWWVIAAAISPLFDRIAITFTKIQARNIVISQQRQEMLKLVADIAASLDIRPATNEALEGVDPLTIIT